MLEKNSPAGAWGREEAAYDVAVHVHHLLELVNVEVAGQGGGNAGTGEQAVQGDGDKDVPSTSDKWYSCYLLFCVPVILLGDWEE